MKYPIGQSWPSIHFNVNGLPTKSPVQSTDYTHRLVSLSAKYPGEQT